jgi:hypothetical protein
MAGSAEVGASLTWATVTVTKATRDTSSGSADRENGDRPSF